MFERKNGAGPGALTLGSARDRLVAGGYSPVSALTPDVSGPLYLLSEHPVALRTLGAQTLAALILKPPEDSVLEQRIRDVLESRGLTRGPVRIGSDGRELYPVRPSDGDLVEWGALEDAVTLLCTRSPGAGMGLKGSLIPLDGAWPLRTLLEVPLAKLPALARDEAQSLFEELRGLPYKIAEEAPARPSRRAWLGVR